MNKKIIVALTLVLVMAPICAQARNISELKGINLVSYEEINEKCLQPAGYDPISGCNLPGIGIFIRNDLPRERFVFVFWHEIGHFFMENITDAQYREVFKPTPQKLAGVVMPEIAADTFALWMMGGKVPEVQRSFFINLLIK